MSTFGALCHFCELHGPCLVMMSQSMREERRGGAEDAAATPLLRRCPDAATAATPTAVPPPPTTVPDLFGVGTLMQDIRNSPRRAGCEGCWSLGPPGGAFVSSDPGGRVSIVSTQDGFGSQAAWAKEAAMKTISCEVLPGRAGTMLLSDNPSASVYAHTFFLKDLMARGFQRYYSIIVGTRERGHLLLAWDTISKGVDCLVSRLTAKCEEQYRLMTSLSAPSGLTKVDKFIRKRDAAAAARNLSQLAGDPAIFLLIHKHMARLLTLVEKLLREEVVAGQPLVLPLQLQEGRTQLFQLLCRKLPPLACRLLLFGLLSGRLLHLCGDRREEVRQSLGLVLPRPQSLSSGDPTRTPWATLSVKVMESLRLSNRSPLAGVSEGPLLVGDLEADLACPTCWCGSAAKTVTATCLACSASGSSALVARWMRIVRSEQLSIPARHMRIVTTVAETVVHAKAWARLKPGADQKNFLNPLGFAKSDAEIFDLYKTLL